MILASVTTESGDVFTWGSNKRGQLGHTPVPVGDCLQPLQGEVDRPARLTERKKDVYSF